MHFKDWANIIRDEIEADNEVPWWCPHGTVDIYGVSSPRAIGIFAQGRMKFINRNLNYFNVPSMTYMAVKNQYEYNPKFSKALEFCNFLRPLINETGPFGRMCIWKIPPKSGLLPHVDHLVYHSHITRYIFCIGTQTKSEAKICIRNTEIEVAPGLLFSFDPYTEKHEFVNYTDRDWYFLGFDYWKPSRLLAAITRFGITDQTDPESITVLGFGTGKHKFTSRE
jgi:hypothetical protein